MRAARDRVRFFRLPRRRFQQTLFGVVLLHAGLACATTRPREESKTSSTESLRREVGENAYRSVAEPDKIEFAELVSVAADEAASPEALAMPAHIAGYPVRGSLRVLDQQTARAVSEMFSDSGNYLPERLGRCAFERLIGFRFARGGEHVDIALTAPCWLAMWTFQRDGHVQDWSSPFHRERASRLYALLGVSEERSTD